MSDESFSDDELEYGRASRRATREKRCKSTSGKAIPTRRAPTVSYLHDALGPLHQALAHAYADEDVENVDFEQAFAPMLPEYTEVREQYIECLAKDGLGRAVEPTSLSEVSSTVATLERRFKQNGSLNTPDALLLRKLKLQQHRATHSLSPPNLVLSTATTLTSLPPTLKCPPPPTQVLEALYAIRTTPYENSFLSRLIGLGDYVTQPAVHTDWEARAPWMEVMEHVRMHRRLKCPDDDLPDETTAPITYVTLSAEHLPQVHDILRRTFWDGVNVSDSLHYEPERATVVAVYKRLVVGVALLSSPQETYITYLAVRSGWENAQIATTMLYLLISRNPNKDFTLHVSANNPAMLLYNRFGFKAEEFVVGFYDAYLDPNARASKNAFRLRLRA